MNEKYKKITGDLKKVLVIALIVLVFFKVHYYKENLLILFKLLIAHILLFILQGYFLMLYYLDELEFSERLIIGLGLGYGVQPLLLYIINVLTEVNILQYNIFVSVGMILVGLAMFYFKNKNQ